MLEIRLYLSNRKEFENFVYLGMKYKVWSTKWEINFEVMSWKSNQTGCLTNEKINKNNPEFFFVQAPLENNIDEQD